MKKLLLILVIGLLAGCENNAVISSKQIDMANQQCLDHNGLRHLLTAGTTRYSYSGHWEYTVSGSCNDGTKFTLTENIKK